MQKGVPLVLPTHPKDHSYKINYQYVEKGWRESMRDLEEGREVYFGPLGVPISNTIRHSVYKR